MSARGSERESEREGETTTAKVGQRVGQPEHTGVVAEGGEGMHAAVRMSRSLVVCCCRRTASLALTSAAGALINIYTRRTGTVSGGFPSPHVPVN